ncbi:hypothetical protein KY285_001371 [Solanum tuberosum]|nr:hypothetical protein KY285_001371 [Solanum tuberosum]
MTSETEPNAQEMASKIEKGEYYDKSRLEDGMLDFYVRLITSGWICFAAEPMKANHTLVAKFYAIVFETNFNGEVVTTI